MLSLRILYVAYPLLTVSEASAGGAEQVLWALEREMAARGAQTTVAASAGSHVAAELFSTGEPCRDLDDYDRRNAEHQDKIVELIRNRAREGKPFDMVHDMSGSFWPRAQGIETPLLATLHLPRNSYDPQLFQDIPANVIFNFVSRSQVSSFTDASPLAGSCGTAESRALIQTNRENFVSAHSTSVVSNGIALDLYDANVGKENRSGLLWLGRICEEKAPHLGLDIAENAQLPIILAGQVYPFSYHRGYFDREMAPRMARMPAATFVESPSPGVKRQLLRQVQAVLITSQVEETSSLVAMEAAACGTPVIATRRGALPEVVQDGITGFLADGVEDAVQALTHLDVIDPAKCVRHAHEHFCSTAMAESYAAIYAHSLATTLDEK